MQNKLDVIISMQNVIPEAISLLLSVLSSESCYDSALWWNKDMAPAG